MNNKGFTLIELLATVVLLGLVMGIGAISVTNVINNSRTKSEKVLVDKLSRSIDDYIDLNSSKLKRVGNEISFVKCEDDGCVNNYSVTAYSYKKENDEYVTLRDLVSERLIDEAKLVNPRNKKKCLDNNVSPDIYIYRDSDYVYYYYVDLSKGNTSCDIEENGIIDTLPDSLVKELRCDMIPSSLKNRKNSLVADENKCSI